jgi:ElaB/YqjD/DUF883 family membrane-anchored ribosome-binding protein
MTAINAQALLGHWSELRARVKDRWWQLTDEDLQAPKAKVEHLVDLIQQKTGEGREVIEAFLSDMVSRGSSIAVHSAEAAGHYAHQAAGRLRERSDRAAEVIRHNPAQSVVAAFGVGLVAGLIIGVAVRPR